MRIILDLPDYDTSKGLQYKWEPGDRIDVTVDEEGVCIKGNAAGLRSLANHLLTLANEAVPRTSHIHLDSYGGLEDGSADLLITKELEELV
jgi:hypothetical protein